MVLLSSPVVGPARDPTLARTYYVHASRIRDGARSACVAQKACFLLCLTCMPHYICHTLKTVSCGGSTSIWLRCLGKPTLNRGRAVYLDASLPSCPGFGRTEQEQYKHTGIGDDAASCEVPDFGQMSQVLVSLQSPAVRYYVAKLSPGCVCSAEFSGCTGFSSSGPVP